MDLNIPRIEYDRVPLFHSTKEIYRSSKKVFFRFLKKFRRSPRLSGRGASSRNTVTTLLTGRNIRAIPFTPGKTRPAVLPSILNMLIRLRRIPEGRELRLDPECLLGWQRREQESLTLILLIDVSRSTYSFKILFAHILDALSAYFHRHDDRIGLISLQGLQARILNHPTRNHRVIIRNLANLEIHGETPLADGLLKALDMAGLEQHRKPGSKSIVILLSDCYPEPLTRKTENIFDEPAYQNVLHAAALYRTRKVSLVVINPAFPLHPPRNLLPGQRLSMEIVRVAGGRLLRMPTVDDPYKSVAHIRAANQNIEKIVSLIENVFTGGQQRRDTGLVSG